MSDASKWTVLVVVSRVWQVWPLVTEWSWTPTWKQITIQFPFFELRIRRD